LLSDEPSAPEPRASTKSSGEADRPELASPSTASGSLKPTLGTASRGAWLVAGAGAAVTIGVLAFAFLRDTGDPVPAPVPPPSPPELARAAPSDAPPAPPSQPPEPAPEATDDAAPSETEVRSIPLPPPRAAARPPARPSVARRAPGDAVSETLLLEQARAALHSHPARALELTRRHQARFPHGVLAQEREVIAIEALQRLGLEAAAKSRAAEFERRYRGSVHQPRVLRGSDTSAPAGGTRNTPLP
jgi:hypothetical protein